jgi:hypothetical protein
VHRYGRALGLDAIIVSRIGSSRSAARPRLLTLVT